MTRDDIIKRVTWDRRFLDVAHLVATWSKDPSSSIPFMPR